MDGEEITNLIVVGLYIVFTRPGGTSYNKTSVPYTGWYLGAKPPQPQKSNLYTKRNISIFDQSFKRI